MADRTELLILAIKADRAATDQAIAKVSDVRRSFRELTTEVKSLDPAASRTARELEKAFGQTATRSVDNIRKRFNDLNDTIDRTRQQAASARVEFDRAESSGQRVASAGSTGGAAGNRFGAFERGLNSTAQLAGGGIAGDAIRFVSDFTGAVDDAGLKSALAGGAIGALAVGIQLLQQESEKARAAADAQLAAGLATIELAKTSTREELEIKRQAALEAQQIAQTQADAANTAYEQFRAELARLNPLEKGALLASILSGIGESGQLYKAAEEAVTGANNQLAKANADLMAIENALGSADVAINTTRAAEEALIKAREDALPRLIQLSEQADAAIVGFGQRSLEISQDRNRRDERELEQHGIQMERQQKAHNDRLLGIGLQGVESLVRIREQGIARLNSIDAELGKLATRRSDVDRKFMESELADFQKFRDTERKHTRDSLKERLRLIEDTNDSLLEAEQANDVSRFIAIQRQGEKDLRRLTEDTDTATQDRLQQFEQERTAAASNHRESLANIQAEIAEKQAARAAIVIENQAALDAERKRIQATKEETIKAFNEQQALQAADRDLRLRYQAEDDRLADQRRLDQLNKQLADIATKARAEAEAIQIVGGEFTRLISAVQNGVTSAISSIISRANTPNGYSALLGGLSSGFNTKPSSSGLSALGAGSSFKAFAFAEGSHGRLVDKPTLGLLGERPGWGDLVIPYPKHGGAAMPGAGAPVIQLTVYQNVGDIASKNDARAIAEETSTLLAGKVLEVTQTALHGRAA